MNNLPISGDLIGPEVDRPTERENSAGRARLSPLIRHFQHPSKAGILTIAGDEDGDIPELTASFVFGSARIELPKVLDSN